MITIEDYYKTTHKTAANSKDFELVEHDFDVFPREGVYIGEFESVTGDRLPALIPIDQTNGICFLTTAQNRQAVINAIQKMVFRLTLSIPPELCKLLLFEGRNDDLQDLPALDDKIKGRLVLTNAKIEELKEKLKLLCELIPQVKQNVMGPKYKDKTLVDYNSEEKALATPYNFVVMTGISDSFDNDAIGLLNDIVDNGRRAGVIPIISFDTEHEEDEKENSIDRKKTQDSLLLLRKMTIIYQKDNRYYIKNSQYDKLLNRFILHLDTTELDPDQDQKIADYITKKLKDDKRIVPLKLSSLFTEETLWKKNAGEGIEVPIGKVNAHKIQYFELDSSESKIFCLIGGESGSGKSNLLHNIICNTAWLYSPKEVQFLLLDFKGTEFEQYKKLPHIKVFSTNTDLDFPSAVLEYLLKENDNRVQLFRSIGVRDLSQYNEKADKGVKLPRLILVVDEFQQMFINVSRNELYKRENIIRQIGDKGRSQGINMIFATNSLSSLDLNNGIFSQFKLRICMPAGEAECNKILGYDNKASDAAVKLSKGWSVYSDRKGYDIYKVAYIDDITKRVEKLECKYKDVNIGDFDRFFFDNKPADIETNTELGTNQGQGKIFVGTPMSELRTTHSYYTLQRENGYNVLLVGEDKDAANSIIYHSVEQIVEQFSGICRVLICGKTIKENPLHKKYSDLRVKFDNTKLYIQTEEESIGEGVCGLYDKMVERKNGTSKDNYTWILAFHNLYDFESIRLQKGDRETEVFSKIKELVEDGPKYGIHIITYIDSWDHYLRIFEVRFLSEWGIKFELNGGEGYKIFDSDESSIHDNYMAKLCAVKEEKRFMEKIKVYKM